MQETVLNRKVALLLSNLGGAIILPARKRFMDVLPLLVPDVHKGVIAGDLIQPGTELRLSSEEMDLAKQHNKRVLYEIFGDSRVLNDSGTDTPYQAPVPNIDLVKGVLITSHRGGDHSGIDSRSAWHL